MLIIVLCMILGVLVGYLLRSRSLKYLNKWIIFLIWVLLFLLGWEVGSNDEVVQNSGTILLQAFLIATGGTLGSLVMAKLLWKRIKERK